MPKRDKKTITIGSAIPYLMDYTDVVPEIEDICKDEYLLGYIKSGAAVEYTEETMEEKDDMGFVSKIITTSEEALVKMGLLTWNGETLQKLIDRCKVELDEEKNRRITKIGGQGNTQGKYYALCLHHIDKNDGDLWLLIVGRNTAGASLTLAPDEGTLVEPEFKAMPQDESGTLIKLVEQLPETASTTAE